MKLDSSVSPYRNFISFSSMIIGDMLEFGILVPSKQETWVLKYHRNVVVLTILWFFTIYRLLFLGNSSREENKILRRIHQTPLSIIVSTRSRRVHEGRRVSVSEHPSPHVSGSLPRRVSTRSLSHQFFNLVLFLSPENKNHSRTQHK